MMIRDIRTLKKPPPVLRVRRGSPLFDESLKIHTGDNANLATEDIRFCWEQEIVAMFNDFKEHFAENFVYDNFYFVFSFFCFLLNIIYTLSVYIFEDWQITNFQKLCTKYGIYKT